MQAEIARNQTKAEQLRGKRLHSVASDTTVYELSDTRTATVRLLPPEKNSRESERRYVVTEREFTDRSKMQKQREATYLISERGRIISRQEVTPNDHTPIQEYGGSLNLGKTSFPNRPFPGPHKLDETADALISEIEAKKNTPQKKKKDEDFLSFPPPLGGRKFEILK